MRRPACYDDLDHADALFIAGSNTAWAHPILFRRHRGREGARGPAMKIIVVDPRRTETAEFADLHLPILPGHRRRAVQRHAARDAVGGLVDAAYIAAHTSGFDALSATRARRTRRARGRGAVRHRARPSCVQAARWFASSRGAARCRRSRCTARA